MKRILFIVSEDWYFVSHRLHLAISAINDGYKVALLSHISEHRIFLDSLSIELIDWPLERMSKNPIKEVKSIHCIVDAIHSFKPDLVHAVAIKPVLYTSLVNFFLTINGVVLALGGLGFVFRSEKGSAKAIRIVIMPILRFLLTAKNTCLIVQNKDDRQILEKLNISNNIELIRGSGVNTKDFFSKPIPHKIPLVILPARILWDKGVGDFVRCAKKCIANKVDVKFALVGAPDLHNPECVPEAQIKEWVEQGVVEWWGHEDDMFKVYNSADIVCFPSYHEGLPKALLEAASCELPIASYDVPGCREVVKDNVNGYLVPFKDEEKLFFSVMSLIKSSNLRDEMGKNGRKIVLENFTQEKIYFETMCAWKKFIE